jgi:hypothetical protein
LFLFLAILFGVTAAICGLYGLTGLATVFRNISRFLFLTFLLVAAAFLILAIL